MKHDTFIPFSCGIGFGFCLLGIAVILCNLINPSETPESIRNSAVAAGVAEWIVSYDSNGSPVLEFKWKQTNQ